MHRAAGLGLLFVIVAWLAWNVGVVPTSGKSLSRPVQKPAPDVVIANVHFVVQEPGSGREQRLLSWVYGAHPWQFDVVVELQNTTERTIQAVTIDGALRFKTGPIVHDLEHDLTDYDASMQAAKWDESVSQTVRRTVVTLAPGEQRTVAVATVDVKRIWMQVEPKGLWPWLLEANVSADNESSFQAVLPILSGD